MRKLLDPLLKDVLEQFQSPAVQEPLEEFVLRHEDYGQSNLSKNLLQTQ